MPNNEKPKKIPETKTHTSVEQNTQPKIKNPVNGSKKSGSLIVTGAFILSLGALGNSVHTALSQQQQYTDLSDKEVSLSTQLDQFKQEQDKIQKQLETKNNHVEELETMRQKQFAELNKQLQTALSQRFYQNQNWLLLKTRYSLELAQINAHWSDNFSTTIALLQQADQLLKQLNTPDIFNIRQAIAKDIALLQAIPPIDVAGILSQLDGIQNSLNHLTIPATSEEHKSSETANSTDSVETVPAWRLRIQDSISMLSKLVIIRHNEEPIKPLLSPVLEAILKENIRLNLQEAQWAVLNNNPSVYQLVLSQAITTLKKNFNEKAQSTAALIKKIEELQQIQLDQKRPEIGSALPLLNQLIDKNDSEITPTNDESKGENP